jgi:hypothetical protein
MGSERVAEALRQAETVFGTVDLDRLAYLSIDPDARQRLLALTLMRRQIARGVPPADYLSLARALVQDPDNDCRWQALIVIGESLATNPEEVWGVIRAYGDSEDADLRMGVATVLLEHLLNEYFEEYLPKVRAEVMSGSARFAETVRTCWVDGCEGPRYRRVQKLLRNAGRGRCKEQR